MCISYRWEELPQGWLWTNHLTVRSSDRPPSNTKIRPSTWLSREWGGGPSPLAGSGAALAAPELTNNATSVPKSDTPTALGGGNRILYLAPTTVLEDQEFPVDIDGDILSAGSSSAKYDDSNYVGSCKTPPEDQNNTSDLSAITEDAKNTPKVIWRRALWDQITEDSFHPGLQDWTCTVRGGGSNPDQNPPGQCWDSAAPHPTSL